MVTVAVSIKVVSSSKLYVKESEPEAGKEVFVYSKEPSASRVRFPSEGFKTTSMLGSVRPPVASFPMTPGADTVSAPPS